MASSAILQQSLERVASSCRNTFLNKIWAGASYGARAYIYQGSSVADMELSSPQFLLLALLHSLVTEEIMSCFLIAELCQNVRQLKSGYLSVWLTGEFQFPRQDVEKAMVLLSKLLEAGLLNLPSHVNRIMSSLATKYRIDGVQLISPSTERCDLKNLLEAAVLNNSHKDIIALAKVGGDVNGSTQSGESLVHLAARLGNCSSISALGFLKANLEGLNTNNVTPLKEAIKNDCESSVSTLLSVGAKVDKRLFRGDTYLHIAAAGGHNRALEALLKGGLDMNLKNHQTETPLFTAVRAGNVHGVKMLLEKGANAGIVPGGGKSLLEMAVESQDVAMFEELFKANTEIDCKDGNTIFHLVARLDNSEMLNIVNKKIFLPKDLKNKSGVTPLHVAQNPSVLKTLIRMGLDVNDKTGEGETPLYLASAKGSVDLLKALCQASAVVDTKNNEETSALIIAVKNSKEDIMTYLLHHGADPNLKDKEGRTALHYAAEGDSAGLVTTLLEAGAKVNEQDHKGNTPAFVATVNNKPAVLQLPLENRADLAVSDCDGYSLSHIAALQGHVEVLKVLLDAGAEVEVKSQFQRTPLHHAAHSVHLAVVAALLDAGAVVDVKDKDQLTPLHYAAEKGHLAVVAAIIEAGAEVDGKGQFLKTPLHYAADKGYLAVVAALLDAGAVVDAKNEDQWTALHLAVQEGHIAVVTELLDRGADLEARENDGTTPLLEASYSGHLAVLQLLVDRGADLDANSNAGDTALSWAVELKHTAVADYLKSKGCRT